MSGDLIACPYCHEGDFDRIGLRSHLLHGDCAAFEETPDVKRLIGRPAADVVVPGSRITPGENAPLVSVDPAGDDFQVWLNVGPQHFRICDPCSQQEAEWMAARLRHALGVMLSWNSQTQVGMEQAIIPAPVASIGDAVLRLTLLASALRRQGSMEDEGRFVPKLLRMDGTKLAAILDQIGAFLAPEREPVRLG